MQYTTTNTVRHSIKINASSSCRIILPRVQPASPLAWLRWPPLALLTPPALPEAPRSSPCVSRDRSFFFFFSDKRTKQSERFGLDRITDEARLQKHVRVLGTETNVLRTKQKLSSRGGVGHHPSPPESVSPSAPSFAMPTTSTISSAVDYVSLSCCSLIFASIKQRSGSTQYPSSLVTLRSLTSAFLLARMSSTSVICRPPGIKKMKSTPTPPQNKQTNNFSPCDCIWQMEMNNLNLSG